MFEVESSNVGVMSKIRIGHDGAGWGAGWHLRKVTVENLATGEILEFECNRWFDKKEDDGAIERDLVPSVDDGIPKISWKMIITTGACSVENESQPFRPVFSSLYFSISFTQK